MNIRGLSIASALLALTLSSCTGSKNHPQPIAFNHEKHVEEVGLSCLDCHTQARTHQKASIPNIETCRNCHEEAMTDSKEEEKLVAYIRNNQPIPWAQVHQVPDHAYFSHRRHVALGEIACQDCHGDVSRMTAPFTKPYTKMDMKFCTRCHDQKQVTNDCSTCHR
jgi:c(7)-type cytochrome triheme protein